MMPALPPQQTLEKRTSRRLFNHLIGAGEQRGRHGEVERLGGLEVDYQFVLCALNSDRQIDAMRR
jgi:hypothetical protein